MRRGVADGEPEPGEQLQQRQHGAAAHVGQSQRLMQHPGIDAEQPRVVGLVFQHHPPAGAELLLLRRHRRRRHLLRRHLLRRRARRRRAGRLNATGRSSSGSAGSIPLLFFFIILLLHIYSISFEVKGPFYVGFSTRFS